MTVVPFAAVAPDSIVTPHVDWLAIAPVLALAGAGVLIVLLRAVLRTRPAVVPVSAVGRVPRHARRGGHARVAMDPRP